MVEDGFALGLCLRVDPHKGDPMEGLTWLRVPFSANRFFLCLRENVTKSLAAGAPRGLVGVPHDDH
jgi:hypothetical protein